MYLKMFGFDEKPFHITPNPRFIFLSKNHKEAFAHLLYGIQQRVGFLSLTGEVGTGKTTVMRTLLGQLEETEYRVALIFNPCLTALELLQTIHREFAIEFDPDRANLIELYDSLNHFLLRQREAGKTVVLVVDEAQNLEPKVLEQLRLLSNLETETEKLIQMILVAQPELDELLQRNDLRQLRQRMAVRYRLQPMDAEDSQQYVQHRVRIAGCQETTLFTATALTQIFRFTRGTPRLINILCDRALLVAYGRSSKSVSKQDVQLAQGELQQQNAAPRFRIATISYGLLVVVILAFAGLKMFSVTTSISQQENEPQPLSEKNPQQIAPLPETPRPIVVPAKVTAERAHELRQKVAELTVDESGLQSVTTIADLWQQRLPMKLPTIRSRGNMMRALALIGFDLVELNISVADLLQLDAPLILEINLPNVIGKRFLTVSHLRDRQLQTVPALTDSGWLSLAELEELWFGKALLPYLNYQEIPLIDRPNISGNKIIKLQQLLSRLKGEQSVSSGVYDEQTIDLVTRFQRQQQLAPDGRVGAHTLYWLYRQTGREMPSLRDGGGL